MFKAIQNTLIVSSSLVKQCVRKEVFLINMYMCIFRFMLDNCLAVKNM